MKNFIYYFKFECIGALVAFIIMTVPTFIFYKHGTHDEKITTATIFSLPVIAAFMGFVFVLGWKKLAFIKTPSYYPAYVPYDRRGFSINPIGIIILFILGFKFWISFYAGLIFLPIEFYKYFKRS